MCPLGVGGHQLRCDAAAAYRAMSAAYAAAFGTPICITDSYRTYAGQVRLYGEKPASPPCPAPATTAGVWRWTCAAASSTSAPPQYDWMKANAGRFGWLHPDWAGPGSGREEPWHWEYAGT